MLKTLPLMLLVLLQAAGCGSSRLPEQVLSGAIMGTTYSVKLVSPISSADRDELGDDIRDTLERIDGISSTYRADSDLSMFNASDSTGWVPVSEELCLLVARALAISRDTDGAFDITVGPLVDLWGFGPAGAVLTPPATDEIAAALKRVGYQHLSTDCAMPAMQKNIGNLRVDLSGWAKGYAVDEVADVLDARAISNYLVEIGGELRAKGHNGDGQAWSIGIEQPLANDRAVQLVLRASEGGIATSGDYRNFFEHQGSRYSHTIDTRTGMPVSHDLAAVTVIHASAADADALATALLVLGPTEGVRLAGEMGLACFFQVRGNDGIESIQTPQFTARVMP